MIYTTTLARARSNAATKTARTDGGSARAALPTCTSERVHSYASILEKGSLQNIIDRFEPLRFSTATTSYDFPTWSVSEEEEEEEVGEELFFFRFRSWIVNHINLLSYRPQWRLRWFMWFQLYGFVNLQPYIIHEFIFHVFSFLPPTTHKDYKAG